jgi:hypothetical protein
MIDPLGHIVRRHVELCRENDETADAPERLSWAGLLGLWLLLLFGPRGGDER